MILLLQLKPSCNGCIFANGKRRQTRKILKTHNQINQKQHFTVSDVSAKIWKASSMIHLMIHLALGKFIPRTAERRPGICDQVHGKLYWRRKWSPRSFHPHETSAKSLGLRTAAEYLLLWLWSIMVLWSATTWEHKINKLHKANKYVASVDRGTNQPSGKLRRDQWVCESTISPHHGHSFRIQVSRDCILHCCVHDNQIHRASQGARLLSRHPHT